MGEFPHCNTEVLHAPGTCKYCDLYPDRQAQRTASNTPFTPAEANGWYGNVAQPETKPWTVVVDENAPEQAPVSAGLTTDPNDPRLTHGPDSRPSGQAEAYLVLSAEERAKGFVRPVRRTYTHQRGISQQKAACGVATTMSLALAQTYARDPAFYGATFCVGCQMHLPVNEFDWEDGTQVGS